SDSALLGCEELFEDFRIPLLGDAMANGLCRLGKSGRSQMGSLPGFSIAATGIGLPEQQVTNEDLAALGCDSEWIVQRTGIHQRRKAGEHQSSGDLAYQAAIDCLKRAGVAPAQVDLVVVATLTPDHATPSTACLLQARLGCIAPAFDLNAACSGFLYALVVAGHMVSSGFSRCALVVGSEVMSRTVSPTDPKTYPLFGDGAGAVLLVPSQTPDGTPLPQSGLIAYTLGSEGEGASQLCIPAGGSREPLTPERLAQGRQYMTMDGRSVFKWAVRVVADAIRDTLADAQMPLEEVAMFVLHQANIRILDAAAQELGIPSEKMFINLDRYGNTSAASVPLALHEAAIEGRFQRGDPILLCGFGAGLTWGSALIRW
ncbi:MAG: beta-ketoacyl-ACP synthase III, partial [Pirellulaceae bacterium]